MKKMVSAFAIALLVTFAFATQSIAGEQQTLQPAVEIGIEGVAPTSNLGDVAGGGVGVRLDLVFPTLLGDITAGIGSLAYGGIEVTTISDRIEVSWVAVPIEVGIRKALGPNLFLQTRGGLIYKTGEIVGTLGQAIDDSQTTWVVTPGLGINYEGWRLVGEYGIAKNNWQWGALRIAHSFGG